MDHDAWDGIVPEVGGSLDPTKAWPSGIGGLAVTSTRVNAPSVPVEQAEKPSGPPPDIQAIHDRAIEGIAQYGHTTITITDPEAGRAVSDPGQCHDTMQYHGVNDPGVCHNPSPEALAALDRRVRGDTRVAATIDEAGFISGNGDTHVAEEGAKWAFDEKVTGVFDKMLEASIPNYQEMRRLTFALGKRFIPKTDGGVVIDIGASRGDALLPFVDHYPNHNYYAVECAPAMSAVLKERFWSPNVTVCEHDLRYNHSVFETKSNLILSVLTLMFVPLELRQRLLQSMYESLRPGGALILVEKCLGADSCIHDMLVEEYLAMKKEHGYTYEQINRKKMALEGVLVPVTAEWNVDMLRRAGFRHIDTFWRSLMFAGFIAIKND